jgi:predicted metal-dependent enzyme (double-stranded beta helix superfamily)
MQMFDLERFIDDCRAAVADDPTHKSVHEIVARAVSEPGQVIRSLGEPKKGEIQELYHSDELTIINVIWAPRMSVMPHNHNMWAVIGVYGGREDNIFWRRVKDEPSGLIEAAGAKSLGLGEATPLGADIIHSVTNPTTKLTGAIHVYGGDFFEEERSEWETEGLTEQTYDVEKTKRLFEEANSFAKAS